MPEGTPGGMLPHSISQRAPSSLLRTIFSSLATSCLSMRGPASFRFTVRPYLSVIVRLVRIWFRMGTAATGNPQPRSWASSRCPASPPSVTTARVHPPKEWITHDALMPRPPGDSLVEIMYARSSNARRSTVTVRSMAGLMVRVTIKPSLYLLARIRAACGSDAGQNADPDQHDHAHADPVGWHVQQISPYREPDDQDDESHDVQTERHNPLQGFRSNRNSTV